MKRIARLGLAFSIVWLAACNVAPTTSDLTPALLPTSIATRSPVPPQTIAAVSVPNPSAASATILIDTATPIGPEPSPTLAIVVRSTSVRQTQATATPTLPECPPLPTPTAQETQSAIQRFEHGLMIWLPTQKEIWALAASPIEGQYYWRVYPDLFSDGLPESDPAIVPPAGKIQPVRGFGIAWREGSTSQRPLREELGWAVEKEIGFATTLTYYPQGFYSPDCIWMPKSGIYELKDNRGNVIQFVGAGGIAKLMTPEP